MSSKSYSFHPSWKKKEFELLNYRMIPIIFVVAVKNYKYRFLYLH